MSQEPDEERSGTERHWDQIGINVLTITAAALAAVFYILVRNDPDPSYTGGRDQRRPATGGHGTTTGNPRNAGVNRETKG